ncbi:MAG TPA: divalent-cation tolerance protein CutA [Steroidobacteraceae bacterium]|nr:divalent-cation tolerance protein CutA [Steroidobacteraceae bacterium]
MTTKEKVILSVTTLSNQEAAEAFGRGLVEAGVAACVNILPGVRSIYRWEGQVESAAEVLLLIKTTEAKWAELQAVVAESHPYELPELIAIPVCAGSEKYLEWIRHSVR